MTVESRVHVPFVDLRAQTESIRPELNEALAEVIERGDFILGESVELFEREMAEFCGVAHGIGVDSGTSGLEMALRAYDIGPGDEVITVANTFIATALAISHTGATPVLVDIDEATYSMDTSQLAAAVTPTTKAIIPVHLYGFPAEMDSVLEVARAHDLVVIEDASQAHGARYKGARVGSIGDTAVFSLYPAKNLGAFGDAGVVVTDDEAVAARLRLLRNYGSTAKYVHEMRGFNRRLDTLQAAVLRVKLRHIDDWNQRRRERATWYREGLIDLGDRVRLPGTADHAEPVYHLFVVDVGDREALQRFLAERGISTLVHYPIPVHLQEAYADLSLPKGSFPVTERVAGRILSLPMYAELTPEMVDHVTGSIRQFLGDTAV